MRYFIIAFVLLLVACGGGAPKELANECSSLYEDNGQQVVVNAYFKILDNENVISIKERKILGDSLEQAVFQIAPAYTDKDEQDWQINFKGEGFSLTKSSLIAETTFGNSDASYSAYSLRSGEKLIEYTYDKLEVLFGDEQKKRYLGFYSNKGVKSEFIDRNSNKNTLGILSYASQDKLLKAIRIEVTDPFWLDILDVSNPVIELSPLKQDAIALNSGKTLYFTSNQGMEDEGVNFNIKVVFYTTDTHKPVEFFLQVRENQLLVSPVFTHSVFHLESL